MAWEENPRICLHMQLIAILSRTGVYICSNGSFNSPGFVRTMRSSYFSIRKRPFTIKSAWIIMLVTASRTALCCRESSLRTTPSILKGRGKSLVTLGVGVWHLVWLGSMVLDFRHHDHKPHLSSASRYCVAMQELGTTKHACLQPQ